MGLKIFLLGLCSLSVVFASELSEIHPGLKGAIDSGNLQLAENLISKVGVRDLYCPNTLSPEDAERLYAEKISSDQLALLQCRNGYYKAWCDPQFVESYVKKSCTGKTRQDSLVCATWMGKESFYAWTEYEDGICSLDKIELCQKYSFNVPDDKNYAFLKRMEEKHLLVFERKVEKQKRVEEKLSYKECMNTWNDYYTTQKAVIQNKSAYAGTFEFLFGYCSFNGNSNDKKNCLKKLEDAGKEYKKECKTGMTRTVEKKVQETEKQMPLSTQMNSLKYHLSKYSWFNLDAEWLNQVKFLQKYDVLDKENNVVSKIKDEYASSGDLEIVELLQYCKIYPQIDKSVEKAFGFELFSCDNLLKNNNPMVACNDETDSTKEFPKSLSGNSYYIYYCDFNTWRDKHVIEESLGMCTRKNLGAVASNGLVCDTVWKDPIVANYACEDGKIASPKYSGEQSYECEKYGNGWYLKKEGNRELYIDLTNNKTYGLFVDSRDGKNYKIIQIGSQNWMAENLNYATDSSLCYNNKKENCDKYGRLYGWSDGVRACPAGWHVPDDDEWRTLVSTIGGYEAGDKLKAKEWSQSSDNVDPYGFSILPAGEFSAMKHFHRAYESAYFWSSSIYHSRFIETEGKFWRAEDGSHEYAFSIRCLKDSD